MKADPDFKKAAKVLLFLLILSLAFTISGRLMPLIVPDSHVEIALTTKFFAGVWAFLSILVNAAIGIWLWCRAKADSRPHWTWLGLGVFGGIVAIAIYLLIPIHEKLVGISGEAEQADGKPE